MFEQYGPLYNQNPSEINNPSNNTYKRLYQSTIDNFFYLRHFDGTDELFSSALVPVPISLFQRLSSVINLGAVESILYSDSIAASVLAINGSNINAKYSIELADTLNSKIVRFYFGGQMIFESVIDYSTGTLFQLDCNVFIIRTGASTARCIVSYLANSRTESQITLLTGLNFAVANDLNLTGEGVVNSDIIALFAKGIYYPQV